MRKCQHCSVQTECGTHQAHKWLLYPGAKTTGKAGCQPAMNTLFCRKRRNVVYDDRSKSRHEVLVEYALLKPTERWLLRQKRGHFAPATLLGIVFAFILKQYGGLLHYFSLITREQSDQ
jgi:adenine-specific DNA glycosylase